jgi:hypothetical protein
MEESKMAKFFFVKCTVSQGLFESEFYITVRDSSVYVDRANVKVTHSPHNGDEVEGKVRAYLIEETGDQVLVELPGEPVVGGLRAWVPKTDLERAFAA